MSLSALTTNWASASDRKFWFDKFKESNVQGLNLRQFVNFIDITLLNTAEEPISTNQQAKRSNGRDNGEGSSRTAHKQEKELFQIFDSNHDGFIDWDEFTFLTECWIHKIYNQVSALVIIDVQNDFIDGSLALRRGPARQEGGEVIPIINKLLEQCSFELVVYTQDWHPPDHIGFFNNLNLRQYSIKREPGNLGKVDLDGKIQRSDSTGHMEDRSDPRQDPSNVPSTISEIKLFDTVLFLDGQMEQKLWPVHCIRGTWGSELHPKLKVVPHSIRILKGTQSDLDAYSAFWDNMRLNETNLRRELLSHGVTDVFCCGLALDYCVAASAMDSAKIGFSTFVIEDACRGLDLQTIASRTKEMVQQGIFIINSEVAKDYLALRRTGSIGWKSTNELEDRSMGHESVNSPSRDLLLDILLCKARRLKLHSTAGKG